MAGEKKTERDLGKGLQHALPHEIPVNSGDFRRSLQSLQCLFLRSQRKLRIYPEDECSQHGLISQGEPPLSSKFILSSHDFHHFPENRGGTWPRSARSHPPAPLETRHPHLAVPSAGASAPTRAALRGDEDGPSCPEFGVRGLRLDRSLAAHSD